MKQKVLVVEDDPEVSGLLKKQLSRMDLEVTQASDGSRAMEALKTTVPDLVCLDLMLPATSGYEVCEHIRKTPRLSTVPILVISARTLPMDRAQAFELGASAFLPKPFSSKDLTAMVKNLLARGQE